MSMNEREYTLDEQIAEVRRELGFRPRVYDRWVQAGKMTQQQADERIGRLRAALGSLEALRQVEHDLIEPKLL